MPTPNMNLTLPVVAGTPGPQYATNINDALTSIDTHNHSAGRGSRVPVAGLTIDDDLDFNSHRASALRSTSFMDQAAAASESTPRSLYTVGGNLYYVNQDLVAIKLTDGPGFNAGNLGGFVGDYVAAGARATYAASNNSYTFTDSSLARSDILARSLFLSENLTVSGAGQFSNDLTVANNLTVNNELFSGNVTAVGSISATLNLTVSGAATVGTLNASAATIANALSARTLTITGNTPAQMGVLVPSLPGTAARFYSSVWAGHSTIASGNAVGLLSGTTISTQAVVPLRVPRQGTMTRLEITWQPQGTAALGTAEFFLNRVLHATGAVTNLGSVSIANVAGNSASQTSVITLSYAIQLTSDETLYVRGYSTAWQLAFQSLAANVFHDAIVEGVRG